MSGNGTSIDWDEIKKRIKDNQTALHQGLTVDSARMRTIFRQRAVRLAERKAAAAETINSLPVLAFRLGNEKYGIALDEVAEILPVGHTTPVPGLGQECLGVFNLHGTIKPLLCLQHVLGLPSSATQDGYIVVLHRGQGELAVQVEQVEQVVPVVGEDLRLPDKQDGNFSYRYLKGVTPDGLIVISTEALFAEYLFQEDGR